MSQPSVRLLLVHAVPPAAARFRWLRLKLEANPAQPTLITRMPGQGDCCG